MHQALEDESLDIRAVRNGPCLLENLFCLMRRPRLAASIEAAITAATSKTELCPRFSVVTAGFATDARSGYSKTEILRGSSTYSRHQGPSCPRAIEWPLLLHI